MRNWLLAKYRPGNQATLLGKTFAMKDHLATLKYERELLADELSRIEHYQTCEDCQVILQLDLERYWGRNSPFYLQLHQGYDLCADDDGAPPVTNYQIGSYGHSSEDTLRFIRDRLEWARTYIEQQLVAAILEIRALEQARCW